MGCSKAKGGHGRGGLELDFEPRKTPGEVVVAEEGEIRKGDWIFVLPKKSSYILACIPVGKGSKNRGIISETFYFTFPHSGTEVRSLKPSQQALKCLPFFFPFLFPAAFFEISARLSCYF